MSGSVLSGALLSTRISSHITNQGWTDSLKLLLKQDNGIIERRLCQTLNNKFVDCSAIYLVFFIYINLIIYYIRYSRKGILI